MNLIESHRQLEVSAYLRVSWLLEDLPQSFSSFVLSKLVCLPPSVRSMASSSVHLMALKKLTQGEKVHQCFHERALHDQCHFWQCHLGSRSPPWSCRWSCLSRTLHSVQKTSSCLCASCPCEEPSSCSSGTRGVFLSHQEVDLLELESHLIDSSHVSFSSCPCGAWWVHVVVDQPANSHQSPKLLLHEHLVWQQSGCTQSDRVVKRNSWLEESWNELGSCTMLHLVGREWDEYWWLSSKPFFSCQYVHRTNKPSLE